jgi:hypothetical protein
MTTKILYKLLAVFTVFVSMGSLTGCTALISAPTPTPSATATPVICQPSTIQTTENGFSEIQGTMSTEGEMWALLFFGKAYIDNELKIVWRMTGEGPEFSVTAVHEDGTVLAPIWGPEYHEGSNWERPGEEWGTGFEFPKPGCWKLVATRGDVIGEIRLGVLAP